MGFDFSSAASTASSVNTLGTGLQAIGAIAATMGSYNKSKAEKEGYEYQSKVSKNNAQIAGWQMDDARQRGEREEQNLRLKTAALKGTQAANMAAHGVDLGVGSALNILTDTDFMGERDALLIRDNAAKEVWGLNVQRTNYLRDAEFKSSQARSINPFMNAGTTLLTGAGAVAKGWYAMRTKTTGGLGRNYADTGNTYYGE